MDYLKELGFTDDDITIMKGTVENSILESLSFFPGIVKVNYEYLKAIGINNDKQIFKEHAHMFLMNPDRFKAIFDKYDHADLVRCLEKNGAVIEKL